MATDPIVGLAMQARWTEIRQLLERVVAERDWDAAVDALNLLDQIRR